MTEDQRKSVAARIVASPWRYKICMACESICPKEVPLCTVCSAYRFLVNPFAVRQHAEVLTLKPSVVPSWE